MSNTLSGRLSLLPATVRDSLPGNAMNGRVFAVLALLTLLIFAPSASAQSIGDRMVTWLESMKGQRVGGGECSHVANEALRVAGASFTNQDPGNGDYIWSTSLVTKVTGTATGPVWSSQASVRPGDVIQYTNARFSSGAVFLHHTSVVATVNSSGRVTAVFEQNLGKLVPGGQVQLRYVQKRPLDLATLKSGYVKIYRPVARKIQARRWEFSLVNNAPSAASVTLRMGTWSSSPTLGIANTAASYRTMYLTSSSSTAPTIRVGSTTLTIVDGAGYEVFRTASGGLSVRRLPR